MQHSRYRLMWGILWGCLMLATVAHAQGVDPNPGISQEDLQRLANSMETNVGGAGPATPDPESMKRGSINFLRLLLDGGVLMVPIALMSLLVVAVAFERGFGLRTARIYPRRIRREVKSATEDTGAVTPQGLYEAAQNNASAASRIMEDTLQKIGRPIPEIEAAIAEGAQREAERLYGNVRWLTLAAAVTPLIGLLGTVWGMIIAFYETTQLGAGSNKAEYLAGGIYVALVTTLGGLAVAIPAAMFAHYFEGKITRVLSNIETDFRRLVPRFESFEGRARYDISARGLTRRISTEPNKRRPQENSGEPASGQRRA
ncbi:MAG: MotA/TolQ/ExbB proton channel family protein [Aureliella sp.]